MENLNNKKLCICISIFLATVIMGILYTNENDFLCNYEDSIKYYYVFSAILCWFMLYLISLLIFRAILGKKTENFEYKLVRNSLPFLIVYLVCTICIYPSVEFGGDMPYFIEAAKSCNLNLGLSWLSTLVYVLGYRIFPIEGGVTIFMGIISSLTYGYVTTKAIELNVNMKYILLLFMPIFTIFSLYPTRMTMMNLVFVIYFTMLYSGYISNIELTVSRFVILCILGGMLAVWRIETKYLIVFMPIFLIYGHKKKFEIKKYIIYLLFSILTYSVLNIPNLIRNIPSEDKLHPIVGYMLPLMEMEGVDWKTSEKYDKLNGYIDMDKMREYEIEKGDELYRADYLYALGVIRENPSVSKAEYVWAAVNECLKNPFAYLKVRIKALCITMNGDKFPFEGNEQTYDGEYSALRYNTMYILNGNKNLGLNIGECSTWTLLWKSVSRIVKILVWQLWWVLIMMLYILIQSLKNKDWFGLAYVIGMWIFAVVVFAFSPGAIFKYYWPIYSYCVLYIIFKSRDKDRIK